MIDVHRSDIDTHLYLRSLNCKTSMVLITLNNNVFDVGISNIITSFLNYDIYLSKLANFTNTDFIDYVFFYNVLIVDTEIKFGNNKKLINKIFSNFTKIIVTVSTDVAYIFQYCKNVTAFISGADYNHIVNKNSLSKLVNLTSIYFNIYSLSVL